MCVSYIFTKIYMYIHTHVFSNLSGGFGWGLGHSSTNFRWYIYITSENGSNWGWIRCSPISDVSLMICLFVRVYRHMARESLRITDSFTSLMSIDCPPKWFWTSFGQVFQISTFWVNTCALANFDGLDLFSRTLLPEQIWVSQSLVHLGELPIDQRTAPYI